MSGLAQAGHTPYSLDGAVSLRNAWHNFRGGRVAIVIAALPFKCPAAPYETALLLEARLRERGVRQDVRIDLFTPETLPMPVAGEALGQALQGMLEKRAIHFHAKRTLSGVDHEQRQLSFADGREAGYELLVYVPAHRSPEVVRQSPLAAESGWIPVDPRTTAHGIRERLRHWRHDRPPAGQRDDDAQSRGVCPRRSDRGGAPDCGRR